MVALINGFILIIDYPRLESAANAAAILTFLLNPSLTKGGAFAVVNISMFKRLLT